MDIGCRSYYILDEANITGSVFLHLVRGGVTNPVRLTEGALVDLGFAGLIEQIEERLGPGVANLVLFAVTALILLLLVRYAVEAVILLDGLTRQDNLYSQMLGYAGLLAFYGFLFLSGDQYFRVRARRVTKELEERMIAAREEREAALAEVRHIAEEIEEKVRHLSVAASANRS